MNSVAANVGGDSLPVAHPVGSVRTVGKATAALSYTLLCGLAVLPTVLVGPIPPLQNRWRRGVIRLWGKGVARIIGMRISVSGTPPNPPYFLVSNHLGYLDIILLASQTGCNFVSRHDVRGWPGIGPIARVAGTLFVDRGNRRDALRVMDDIRSCLNRGVGVAVFPEGTSTRGDRVFPLKSTMLQVPACDNVAVHHATVRYQTSAGMPPAHELVCWWGDMKFGGHFMELCRWPGFDADVSFGSEPIVDSDRKALAHRLHAAIADRFKPVGEGEA